jgi:hypothetical protein
MARLTDFHRQQCVHVHKNCNTTRGTLFVSKMCMKLVVYSSRTRGFDGRIFVVRTVNIHDNGIKAKIKASV